MEINGLIIDKVPIVMVLCRLEDKLIEDAKKNNEKVPQGEDLRVKAISYADTINGMAECIQCSINCHNQDVTPEKIKKVFELIEPEKFLETRDIVMGSKDIDTKKN